MVPFLLDSNGLRSVNFRLDLSLMEGLQDAVLNLLDCLRHPKSHVKIQHLLRINGNLLLSIASELYQANLNVPRLQKWLVRK